MLLGQLDAGWHHHHLLATALAQLARCAGWLLTIRAAIYHLLIEVAQRRGLVLTCHVVAR